MIKTRASRIPTQWFPASTAFSPSSTRTSPATPVPTPLNVSVASEKKPEYGVAGLRDAGVRVEYVRAGDTAGEFSSLSSPSWLPYVGAREFGRMSEGPLEETSPPFPAAAGSEPETRMRDAALGTFMLFLLVKSVWVSGTVIGPELLWLM